MTDEFDDVLLGEDLYDDDRKEDNFRDDTKTKPSKTETPVESQSTSLRKKINPEQRKRLAELRAKRDQSSGEIAHRAKQRKRSAYYASQGAASGRERAKRPGLTGRSFFQGVRVVSSVILVFFILLVCALFFTVRKPGEPLALFFVDGNPGERLFDQLLIASTLLLVVGMILSLALLMLGNLLGFTESRLTTNQRTQLSPEERHRKLVKTAIGVYALDRAKRAELDREEGVESETDWF